jgi:DNA-binding NarL/FixJ family response regulator
MRVLIAEDQLLLRDGLTRMLTAYGFDVVATVDDGSQLAETLVSVRPDVAVVDVRLPRPPSPTKDCVPPSPPAARCPAFPS